MAVEEGLQEADPINAMVVLDGCSGGEGSGMLFSWRRRWRRLVDAVPLADLRQISFFFLYSWFLVFLCSWYLLVHLGEVKSFFLDWRDVIFSVGKCTN